MPDRQLSYRTLERGLWKRAIPYSFAKGNGGVLTFLWAVGAGVLSVVFQMPALAGALTGILIALEAFMARGYLRAGESRSAILRAALERHLDLGRLGEEPLRAACARAIDLFIELAAKVHAIGPKGGASGDLAHVLAAGCEMLALQVDAALRVEEYGRILALLERGAAPAAGQRALASLRDENLRTMVKLVAEERQLVADVGARLETALLQVLQVTRGPGDVARAAELARAADEALHDLQAVVEARRETADMIRRTLVASST
jgi:hypothetical protein